MTRPVDWRDLPALMAADGKSMRRAAAWTLNTLAFDALPEIVEDAQGDLKFSGNARRALGMYVETKARADRLEAAIGTKRRWLYYHTFDGVRRTLQGLRWSGRRWLILPVDDAFVTKRGRIKARFLRKAFVLNTDPHPLLVRRVARGKKIQVLATLHTQLRHRELLTPGDTIRDVMQRKGTRLLRRGLEFQRARTRR